MDKDSRKIVEISDMKVTEETLKLQADVSRLHNISSFYRKMIKEFNVQQRGVGLGPPQYSMTLYFQSHLEDEAVFYERLTRVLDERIEELNNDDS